MKACFLAGMDLTKTDGASVHSLNLIKGLRAAGVQVQVISFDSLHLSGFKWLRAAPHELHHDCGTILIRSPFALPLIEACRRRKLKSVLLLPALKHQECKKWMRTAFKLIENQAIARADAVAVISPQLEAYAASHGAKRVLRYLPPIDFNSFARAKAKRGSEFVFGYVGTADSWQGLGLLLEAFSRVKADCELRIYGKMPVEVVAKASADKRVKIFGAVANDKVPELLASFDVFVLPRPSTPTVETTTPIKLVEAMAAGCAVISTDVGGAAWLLRDGVNALVCKPSIESLRSRMSFALNNRSKLHSIGLKARDTVRDADFNRVGLQFKRFISIL